MKKLLLLVMVFVLTFSIAFSQEEATDKTPNAFLDYMQGRSAVGFNFAPSFTVLAFNLGLNYGVPSLAGGVTGGADTTVSSDKPKFSGYAMSFNYDFTVLPFMAVTVDVGFALSSFDYDLGMTDSANGTISLDYSSVSYAVGVKFFTGRNAPWGFYLYPKIGGDVMKIKAIGKLDNETINFDVNPHGVYASLELGWRIQLFPKTGKDWPVQIGIDIALFDIGYYFVPWTEDILAVSGQPDIIPNGYKALANIRFIPIPRLGFTLRF